MKQDHKHLLLLNFGVLITGFTSLFPKLIHLPPVEIIFGRSVVSATALAITILVLRQSYRLPGGWKELLLICGLGGLLAAHWTSLYHAIQISNVAVVIIALKTNVLMMAFLEHLRNGCGRSLNMW